MRPFFSIAALSLNVAIGLAICGSSPTSAQQRPTLGYVFPPGSQPGQTIEVQLGGYDLTPDTRFLMLDERISMEIVSPPGPILYPGPPHWFGPRALNSYKPYYLAREATARLTSPSDLPTGVVYWQAVNANGASDPAPIIIGDATAEVSEASLRPASDGGRLVPAIPIVINGCLAKKEEVDHYRWTADQSGLITLQLPTDCLSQRFDAVIQIEDNAGNKVLDVADPAHRGICETFAVTKGTEYRIALFDLDYRGDRSMVYRLSLRYGPRIIAMLPPSVPPNSRTEVRLFGYGLTSGQPQLGSITRTLDSQASDFVHAIQTDHGPAGSLHVTVSPSTWMVSPDALLDPKSPGPGRLDELPVSTLPVRFAGRLNNHSGYGFHRFSGKQGEEWSFDLRPIGRSHIVSPAFSIIDETGKTLLFVSDDANVGSVRSKWSVPQDGEYSIAIGDLSGNGDQGDAFYQLQINQPRPDFELIAPSKVETFIGADEVKVGKTRRRGQQQVGVLGLDIDRIDGLENEIRIAITGLPDGYGCPEEMIVPEKASGIDIPIHCEASVSAEPTWIEVSAESIPGKSVSSETRKLNPGEGATTDEGLSTENVSPIQRKARVLLSPIMAPPVVITPKYPDGARTVNRGATYPAPVVIQRSEDFEGPVELQMAAVPDRVRQGIYGDPVQVPADVDEAIFPLVIPEWVQTDRTSRIILNSVVQVPDASGTNRYLVNRMKQRITMNVEGALLKVNDQPVPYLLRTDGVEIPFTIFRSGELTGPVSIQLRQTSDAVMRFHAQPITLQPSQTNGNLHLKAGESKLVSGEHVLKLMATGSRDGYPVLSETDIIVIVDLDQIVSR
ncbi:MAG: hypothetical protein R3C05_12345 [Pirellulaceae bacterium]